MIAFSSLMVPALPHYKHKNQLKLSLNEKLFHSQLPTSSSTYDEIPRRPTRLWLSRKSVTKRKGKWESSASSTFRRKPSAAIAEDINHSKAFAPRKLAFKLFFANEISLSSRNWNKLISTRMRTFLMSFSRRVQLLALIEFRTPENISPVVQHSGNLYCSRH